MALPLVDAARHNDVKPLLGRELMILTHDDDDVCMYVCIYVRMYSLTARIVPWRQACAHTLFTFVSLETRHVLFTLTPPHVLLRFVHLRTSHV